MSGFRVDGLISGLNTSDIINDMMAIERRPIGLLQQKKLGIELRRDAWKDVTSRVQNLLNTAKSLVKQDTIAGNTVKIATPNPSLAASAGAQAVAGTYSVTISQLATGTTRRSEAPIAAEISTSAALNATNLASPVTAGSFSINGVAVTVDPASDSLDDVVARINGAGTGVTASLVTVDGRHRLALEANVAGGAMQLGSSGDTSNFLSATKVLAAPRSGDTIAATGSLAGTKTGEALANAAFTTPVTGSGTLTINNVEIAYNAATDSLNTVINRINSSSANVTARYDAINDRFILQNKQTGSVTMQVADTGSLLSALGVDSAAAEVLGANAAYSLDGGLTTRYSSSNRVTDAISGVTLTFNATSATATEITVAPDIDQAVGAVKKFVEQYNSTMSLLRDKTAYNAATKKGGVLMGDSGARELERSLRQFAISPAITETGLHRTLGDVGISFGAFGSALGTTNDLTINETKLRAALTENTQAVFQLFAATHSAAPTTIGDIASIAGTPTDLTGSGHYQIVSDGAGNLTATFINSLGVAGAPVTGTIAPGGTNTTLIPGLTLVAEATLTGATTEIDVTYQQGVLTRLNQYLTANVGPDGALTSRVSSVDKSITAVDDSIKRLEGRLGKKQERLVAEFTRLERLLSQLQTQSSALASQLSGLDSRD